MSSCAVVSSPAFGGLYSEVKSPLMVTNNKLGKKVGVGEFKSILGIVAMGDASIETIAKDAGIKRISHVDYETSNVLTFIATGKVYVYGD